MPARGRKFPARSCSLLSFRDFFACLSHTFITTSPLCIIAHFCYSFTINISRNTLSVKGVRPTVVAANRSGSRRLSPSVVPHDVTVPHFPLSTLPHSYASLSRVTQSSQSLPSLTFARVSHSRHAIVSIASIRHVRTRLSLAVHTCFHRTHHRQLIPCTAVDRAVPAACYFLFARLPVTRAQPTTLLCNHFVRQISPATARRRRSQTMRSYLSVCRPRCSVRL